MEHTMRVTLDYIQGKVLTYVCVLQIAQKYIERIVPVLQKVNLNLRPQNAGLVCIYWNMT